ncbi:cytochrome P450 [Dactylonectria macrodidyma]|uniref:Cytochrome P450 n=1 Tax=Dactylonectria macrodidyma TaxID=307937 RepID=A0A9P9EHZ4_9HYPO|nr:cytochrome P450 [Dactylonectria macrodidyma]
MDGIVESIQTLRRELSLPRGLVAVIALVFLYLLSNKYRRGLSSLPGPRLAAYSSLWRYLDVRGGQAHQTAIRLHRKYGEIVRIGPNHVSVSDPREIKKIYGLKSGYTKSAFYPIQSITWKGKVEVNLFGTRDEAYHRQLKKPVANAFSLTSLLSNEAAVDSCTKLLLEKLSYFADGRQLFDLGEWIQFYTFDVMGELTFAQKLGFLDNGGDVDGMIQTIEDLLVYASQIGQIPEWHKFLMGNPLLPIFIPNMEGWNKVLTFTLKAVNAVMGGEVECMGDMLSKWFATKLANPEKISTRDIVVHLSTNVFAGSDTTAIALRATLYHLLKNPVKLQKLVKEIDDAAAGGLLSSPISFRESTTHLPYMQAVLKEGLRIHPSVGLLLERHVPSEGATICGRHIPGGTIVGHWKNGSKTQLWLLQANLLLSFFEIYNADWKVPQRAITLLSGTAKLAHEAYSTMKGLSKSNYKDWVCLESTVRQVQQVESQLEAEL